jgi:hypothetical protein
MLWEYRSVYPHLRQGGLLVSDDALWNSAFPEFAREMGVKHGQIIHGVGFLLKEQQSLGGQRCVASSVR